MLAEHTAAGPEQQSTAAESGTAAVAPPLGSGCLLFCLDCPSVSPPQPRPCCLQSVAQEGMSVLCMGPSQAFDDSTLCLCVVSIMAYRHMKMPFISSRWLQNVRLHRVQK